MRVALLASVFALAACDVGEVPANNSGIDGGGGDGGGVNPQASAMYTAMVVPIVGAAGRNCAQASCHAVQPPVLTSFETLTNNGALQTYAKKPSTSNKLIVGPASLNAATNMHQGVLYFDATQKATVSMWIDMYGF